MKEASPELEQFIDESINRSRTKGYYPTGFEAMRVRWRTKEAIRRLVTTSEIHSGFRQMLPLGLQEWTLEAAVLKFSGEFDREEIQAANWRLKQAGNASRKHT